MTNGPCPSGAPPPAQRDGRRLRAARNAGTDRAGGRRAVRRRAGHRLDRTRGGTRMRLVVADDQTVVREGLVTLLSTMAGIEVVGSAADGEQTIALVAQHAPDVVLMDLRMPRLDGIEATRRIRADHPDVQVVVLTTYADDESIVHALQAGALGYLTKDAGREHIRRALEAAAAGQAVLDPAVQARLVDAARLSSPAPARAARPTHRARGRRTSPDRRRPVQWRDRQGAVRQRGHREDARQPHLRQDRQPRPCASHRIRTHAPASHVSRPTASTGHAAGRARLRRTSDGAARGFHRMIS